MKKICKTKLPAMLLVCMLLLSACGGQPASAGMAEPAASGSEPESVFAPGSVSEPEEKPDAIVYEGWNRDAGGCCKQSGLEEVLLNSFKKDSNKGPKA